MNHGSQFQQLWRKLRSEVLALQQRGYYGDGAYDTCGSGVNKTFLNVVPLPTFLHPFYIPTFLISDPSECIILAWSHFVFRKLLALNQMGFIGKLWFSPTQYFSSIVVLGPHKRDFWEQDIGLQVNDFQILLPLRDTRHPTRAPHQNILFVFLLVSNPPPLADYTAFSFSPSILLPFDSAVALNDERGRRLLSDVDNEPTVPLKRDHRIALEPRPPKGVNPERRSPKTLAATARH